MSESSAEQWFGEDNPAGTAEVTDDEAVIVVNSATGEIVDGQGSIPGVERPKLFEGLPIGSYRLKLAGKAKLPVEGLGLLQLGQAVSGTWTGTVSAINHEEGDGAITRIQTVDLLLVVVDREPR